MATIRVMSGGAPQAVFGALTPEFEKRAGHKVKFSYAVMAALKAKLAAGEKADILVMPSALLDGYQNDGVVRAEGRAVLGLVGISAVVREGTPHPDLSTPDAVRRALLTSRSVVVSTPGVTPSGTHMGKLIEQMGIADAIAGKIVHRPALDGGVQLVANGEADLGFYPTSEVVNIDGLAVVGPLPAALQLTIVYSAAITMASAAPDAAAAFIAFVTDRAHRSQWARAGFDPPRA